MGPQGTQLLQDAIACGRDAWSGAYAPDNLLERMELGNALASALSIRGVWQGGEQGKKDLSESIKICQMLLEAGIDSQSTVAYALLRETLANAKIKTAVREQDKEGLRLLDQAIPLLQKVLLQYAGGRDRDRESRARIQNTIADAHRYYALRRGGWRWRNRIDKAVKAHREALDTLGDHGQYPVQMAAIYNDLGNTLRNKAVRGSDADRIAYLDEAIAAFRMALKVRKREYHPVAWSGTYNNLGIAYNDMGEVLIDRNQANDIKSGETYIKRAVIAYRWALKIRTSDAQSIPWAMSQDNLGSALTDLANVKMRQGTWEGTREGLVLLQEAERCFCAALELYTEEYNANDRVNTQLNLAYAYFVMSVGAIHHATENVKEAGGLEFYTKTSKKWQRGLTRLNALAREVAKQDSRPYTRDQKERR